MPKQRQKSSPGKILFGLGFVLLLGVIAALFAVLGSDPGEGEGLFGAPDPADVAENGDDETDTDEDASGKKPRQPGKSASGTADAAVAAAVRGVVRLYHNRLPVGGLQLSLTRTIGTGDGAETETLSATTGTDGVFRFDMLEPSGGYSLRGEQEPYAPLDVPGIALTPTETTDLGTLWLAIPVDMHVLVVTTQGVPVKDAVVHAYGTSSKLKAATDPAVVTQAEAIVSEIAPTADATTTEDGTAVIKGLRPGRYHVRASADSFGIAARKNVLVAPEKKSPPIQLILFPGHPLAGTVVDVEGAPVAGASVVAAPVLFGSAKFDKVIVATDEKGAYAMTGLAPGRYQMYLSRPETPVVLGQQIGIPDTKRYDFRLRPTATILGTVTAEGGEPIADAEVRYAAQGGRAITARTGEDGGYRIENVPPGPSQYFRVKAEGFVPFPDPSAPQQGSGESLREGGEIRRDIELLRGATVVVTVTTAADGKPVEGARATLHMAQMWGSGQGNQSASTDANGVANVTGLLPGPYILEVQSSGHVQPDLPIDFRNSLRKPNAMPPRWRIDVPREGRLEVAVPMVAGATVSGTVKTKDGEPVVGVEVTVTGARPLVPVFTDEAGAFTVGSVPAHRRATATAKPSDLPSATSEPFLVEAGKPVTEIEIELTAGGTIRGKVRSQEGGPLSGAVVRFRPGKLQGTNTWQFNQFNNAKMYPVKDDGSFEITGVTPGNVTVRADAEDHLPAWDNTVEVIQNQETGGIDLILKTSVRLSGRVESPDGRPVAGATVTANYMGTAQQRQWGFVAGLGGNPSAQTDDEGLFALRGLQPGKYRLNANAPGYTPAKWIEHETGAGDVILKLGMGERISGVVKDESGSPLGGIPVQAKQAGQGNNRNPWGWGGGGPRVFTAGDGTFEFLDLAEGAYDLTVSAAWIWGREVNVEDTNKAGVRTGTDDLEIVVKAGHVIEGTVIDNDKKPVAVGWVYSQFQGANNQRNWANQRWAKLSADGTFRLAGLAPGTYTLTAYGDFMQTQKKGVSTGTDNVEVEVKRGITIRGTFIDEKGLAPSRTPNVQMRRPGEQNWQGKEMIVTGGGDFVITGLDEGNWDINFQAWGKAPVMLENIAAGTVGLEVRIVEGLEIAGVVVDASGSPLSGVRVDATQLNVPAGGRASNGNGRTNDKGEFSIKGLLDGEFRLFLRANNMAIKIVEPIAAGADGQRFVMDAGLPITGTVKTPDGTGTQANLQLLLDGQQLSWSRCDAQGNFTIQNAPSSGTFSIRVYASVDGKNYNFVHENVEAGAENVEITLK